MAGATLLSRPTALCERHLSAAKRPARSPAIATAATAAAGQRRRRCSGAAGAAWARAWLLAAVAAVALGPGRGSGALGFQKPLVPPQERRALFYGLALGVAVDVSAAPNPTLQPQWQPRRQPPQTQEPQPPQQLQPPQQPEPPQQPWEAQWEAQESWQQQQLRPQQAPLEVEQLRAVSVQQSQWSRHGRLAYWGLAFGALLAAGSGAHPARGELVLVPDTAPARERVKVFLEEETPQGP